MPRRSRRRPRPDRRRRRKARRATRPGRPSRAHHRQDWRPLCSRGERQGRRPADPRPPPPGPSSATIGGRRSLHPVTNAAGWDEGPSHKPAGARQRGRATPALATPSVPIAERLPAPCEPRSCIAADRLLVGSGSATPVYLSWTACHEGQEATGRNGCREARWGDTWSWPSRVVIGVRRRARARRVGLWCGRRPVAR